MSNQAVILAGGKGTRLMPLTRDIPKPLVSVLGKPFLYWQLRYLRDQGVESVLLLVSHLGHLIEEHFRKNPIEGLEITFAREPEPLGTGGALRLALDRLRPEFWLLNGDSFLACDLRGMPDANCLAAFTDLSRVDVPANLRLAAGRVIAYRKGAGAPFDAVDAGVYRLERAVVAGGPTGRFDLEAYWPDLIERGALGAHVVRERFYDIGTPERLKTFEEYVRGHF